METTLELTISLTSDTTFDIRIYEPESGESKVFNCHDFDVFSRNYELAEDFDVMTEIRSWVKLMRGETDDWDY